jgi:hypothetical protein
MIYLMPREETRDPLTASHDPAIDQYFKEPPAPQPHRHPRWHFWLSLAITFAITLCLGRVFGVVLLGQPVTRADRLCTIVIGLWTVLHCVGICMVQARMTQRGCR